MSLQSRRRRRESRGGSHSKSWWKDATCTREGTRVGWLGCLGRRSVVVVVGGGVDVGDGDGGDGRHVGVTMLVVVVLVVCAILSIRGLSW